MKVGLSLGGGGARGLSHVIIFEILDELGVEVSAISGSSIGALMGMGYANGMTGREIRSFALGTFADSTKVLGQLWSMRPSNLKDWFNPQSYSFGQLDPQKILSLFTPIDSLPERVEDLATPMTIVATDYYAWKEVGFRSGSLSETVGASIAIPMVFRPVTIDGRVMVDGNVTNPMPVDHLPEDMDRIIAVNVVGGPEEENQEVPSGFETMLGANQIMMQAITREKLAQAIPPDVIINPPINQFGVLDFLKASTIVRVTDSAREQMKRDIANALEK